MKVQALRYVGHINHLQYHEDYMLSIFLGNNFSSELAWIGSICTYVQSEFDPLCGRPLKISMFLGKRLQRIFIQNVKGDSLYFLLHFPGVKKKKKVTFLKITSIQCFISRHNFPNGIFSLTLGLLFCCCWFTAVDPI